jgi:hypothetical protein
MAHGGDGGVPPCGCWNACGRRLECSHAYRTAALTSGQAGAYAARLTTIGIIERRPLASLS